MKKLIEKLNVGQRLTSMMVFSVVLSLVLTGLGLYGLNASKASLKTVFDDRLVPTADLSLIRMRMLENQLWLERAASHVDLADLGNKKSGLALNKQQNAESVERIKKNAETINGLWKAYMATYLTPEEEILAKKFADSRESFIATIIKPSLTALQNNDYSEVKRLSSEAKTAFKVPEANMNDLLQLQQDVAKAEFVASEARYNSTLIFSVAFLAVGIALLAWVGFWLKRSITNPLNKTISVFGEIEKGHFDTAIEITGKDELSQVLLSLNGMQNTLKSNEEAQIKAAEELAEQSATFAGQLEGINRSMGVIEFSMDGKVTAVNDIFLGIMGYSREEAIGQHHSVFVEENYRKSTAYQEFWATLNRGEYVAGKFSRIAKDGKEVWLEATYSPIKCAAGKTYKVVKYATDITAQTIKNADYEGQIAAIEKSQGLIEVALDGTILKTNAIYNNMLGYAENELVGQSVSKVIDSDFYRSDAYKTLWTKITTGGSDAGQYKRITKNGGEVWIQASYNPIRDAKGNIQKVVNYTIDITADKMAAADNNSQIAAINKVQGVIEFDLTGKIIAVNDNFVAVTGYRREEIVGNHHSMFVDAAYKASAEYKQFWQDLANGIAQDGQFKRVGNGGREIWLQATYNPILNLNGQPYKVVKFATEITAQHQAAKALEAAVEESQSIIQGAKLGDLSSRVSLEGKTGAIASLCDGINALMDKMAEVIAQVREAGETINTAANEIATGNNDLSSRTEQQASSLEETASSMEELASTVKQNAENAKQANQLAAAASGVAVKGGVVVGNVVTTMADINSSARKIEDIISVIDGIAFQTNILALNAAVEAARAGEQGRGFAVVAGEVRNLAQRSASAAKEIKELISDSVSKVQEGTQLVEDAGSTMQEIVSSVQRVTDIMGEISAASSEQSAGIDQVNNAITSMDEVTQQNAALVEEAAAAAESLVEQAASLMDTVNQFKLAGGQSYANQGSSLSATTERRALNSPMRGSASTLKPATKPAQNLTVKSAEKVSAKTGTDDGEWEEF